MNKRCDALIIGGGIVGISVGIALLKASPKLKVIIAEKENSICLHASGRNSGVLHAGFYYSPDSLKAKFCRIGNKELRIIANKFGIPVNEVGKVVVSRNLKENLRLHELLERGIKNGVEVELRKKSELKKFEPLAMTYEDFLWSPSTCVSDPIAITEALLSEFIELGGHIQFNTKVKLTVKGEEVIDTSNNFQPKYFVNCAGAQADRISREIGVGVDYAMLPFMGVYRSTNLSNLPLRRLVYPVPHPINPFLGVHFTVTINNKVKIGPTAIPILGREQYSLFTGWSSSDLYQAIKGLNAIIKHDFHDFSAIFKSEWPKIFESLLLKESARLVPSSLQVNDWHRKPPGIRSQLVHLPSGRLEQDFVVRSTYNSTHVLNAVSPGWTSALPFGRWVADDIVLPNLIP